MPMADWRKAGYENNRGRLVFWKRCAPQYLVSPMEFEDDGRLPAEVWSPILHMKTLFAQAKSNEVIACWKAENISPNTIIIIMWLKENISRWVGWWNQESGAVTRVEPWVFTTFWRLYNLYLLTDGSAKCRRTWEAVWGKWHPRWNLKILNPLRTYVCSACLAIYEHERIPRYSWQYSSWASCWA